MMCDMAYSVPDLPYPYDALEPHISEEIMRIHHDKHHRAYVDKANAALAGTEWEGMPPEEILTRLDDLPEDLRDAVRDNVGGHYNHSLLWPAMKPDGGGQPGGKLLAAIKDTFGNFKVFKDTMREAAMSQFGSGWAWLVVDGGKLAVTSTPNQDNPITNGQTPLLGNDVWEHAYYLKYQNKRPDYIDAWWNVVNWQKVAEGFSAASG
jgi:Fe-Mn family superoxide dismutase